MITGKGECQGVLDPQDGRVGDGLRYHILDVWVDGLLEVDRWETEFGRGMFGPVQKLAQEGATRTLRERARRVTEDDRVQRASDGQDVLRGEYEGLDDEFEGFE